MGSQWPVMAAGRLATENTEHCTGNIGPLQTTDHLAASGHSGHSGHQLHHSHPHHDALQLKLVLFPPEVTEEPVVVLPTNAPYVTKYSSTTTYHWPNFDQNVTKQVGGMDPGQQGPFGFGKGVELTQQQCVIDNEFAPSDDNCTKNPKECPNGFTVSLFYKSEYVVNIADLSDDFSSETGFNTTKHERETILSTGGDYGVPGIQIYKDGPFLGALVSTGDMAWEVKVKGVLPKNNSWTNIAIRWEPLKFDLRNQSSFDAARADNNYDMTKLGGLQLILNLEMIGNSLLPLHDCTETNGIQLCELKTVTVEDGFENATMMLGCHSTASNTQERQFSGGGVFDEVAVWHRRIPDNESHMLLGGWKESFDQVSTDELVNMMDNVDFSDPNQAAVALQLLQNAVAPEETTPEPFRNIYPSTTTTTTTRDPDDSSGGGDGEGDGNNTATEAPAPTTTTSKVPITTQTPEQQKEAFVGFINVMKKLSNPDIIPANLTQEDFLSRIETARVIGGFLDMNGKNHEKWEMVNEDPNVFGSHDVRQTFEKYIAKALQNLVLTGFQSVSSQRAEIHGANSFVQFEKISNPEVLRRQIYEDETFVFPMWRKRAKRATGFKPYVVGESLDKWDSFPDSIEIPLMLFSGKCAEQDISLVGTIYENFPEPGRKDPVNIHSNKIKLDSRVITINAFANSWNKELKVFSETCKPDPKLLYRKKLMVTMETKDKVKSKRQLMFHEFEDKTMIVKRHCAMWNPEIGLYGAWSTVDIETVSIDENSAVCVTDKLGTYAIVAELAELPTEYDEPGWLFVTRVVGYCLSCVLLLAFVVIVLMSAYLWEMFHILRMNLSVALIVGNVAVLLGELTFIQEDRHACTVVGCLISYFYTASAFILACEGHACFKAITSGIIDGKSGAYLPLAWGMPMIALGANIFMSLMSFGDDPRCWVGWDNMVKWQFFIPLLAGAGLSLLAMLIVVCNLATPAIRKSSILEEMSTLTYGLMLVVFMYCLTWSMAPLAYIRFPSLGLPDFYPAFQVLNSLMGTLVFIFLGLSNVRFRAVITGTVQDRQKNILQSEAGEDNADNVSVKTENSNA